MAKLTKPFTCVPDGEIYPRTIEAGEECPKEHEQSARAQGCLDGVAPKKAAKAK